MTPIHEFEGSKAKIEREEEGFMAECGCGWSSGLVDTKEEAVIEFEEHVQSDPTHRIEESSKRKSYWSLFLGILSLGYVVSPLDFVPDTLVGVGWVDDAFFLIFAVLLLKEGWNGKSPMEIVSDIF